MSQDPVIRTLLGLCTAILAFAGLYFARTIFAPVTFSLFIIAIVWPFQSRLQTRLPKRLALAVSVLGLLEVDVTQKIVERLERNEMSRSVLRASADIASKFRRYMLVRTVMSVLTGAVVWAVALLAAWNWRPHGASSHLPSNGENLFFVRKQQV